MPPRISLAAALRRPSALFRVSTRAQTAQISTSKPSQALRNDFSSPTPQPNNNTSPSPSAGPTSTTSAILGMDSGASSSSSPATPSSAGATDPTNAASGIYEQMSRRGRGAADDATSAASTFSRIFAGGNSQQQTAPGAGTGVVGAAAAGMPPRRDIDSELRNKGNTDDFARQMPRRWRPGDVYAPHDLSPAEMGKWRRSRARERDLVDMLGLKPLDMYRNFSVISEFMTPHGRIKRSAETGLRPVNQRKMAKAIRRAIGLGLHPSVHHHPEILARDPVRRASQNQPTISNYKF